MCQITCILVRCIKLRSTSAYPVRHTSDFEFNIALTVTVSLLRSSDLQKGKFASVPCQSVKLEWTNAWQAKSREYLTRLSCLKLAGFNGSFQIKLSVVQALFESFRSFANTLFRWVLVPQQNEIESGCVKRTRYWLSLPTLEAHEKHNDSWVECEKSTDIASTTTLVSCLDPCG